MGFPWLDKSGELAQNKGNLLNHVWFGAMVTLAAHVADGWPAVGGATAGLILFSVAWELGMAFLTKCLHKRWPEVPVWEASIFGMLTFPLRALLALGFLLRWGG